MPRSLVLLLLTLLLQPLHGCFPPPPDDDDTSAADDDTGPVDDDDTGATDDDDATPADPTCSEGAGSLAVEITEELGRLPICQDPEPWVCADGYDAFFEHPQTQLESTPLPDCEGWVQELLEAAQAGEQHVDPEQLPPDTDLGAEILARTGMGFLFDPDAFPERPLSVAVIGRSERTSATGAPYRQLELLLEDPFIGEMQALLLLPAEGDGPFPTVLALPGHIEGAEEHRDWRFGQFFPENGFALMILTFRAYQQTADHIVSVDFLCDGFHLMTFRAYEAMVALKFLMASPLACNSRLGVIGHSGGSITGGLLVWLHGNPARAYVSDGPSWFNNIDQSGNPEQPWTIDCETHLGLSAIADTLLEYERAPMPVQMVPYGYAANFEDAPVPEPDDLDALLQFIPFFRHHLLDG